MPEVWVAYATIMNLQLNVRTKGMEPGQTKGMEQMITC
jgi:hypothetical protein